MHPEIRRDAPGSCPICGMALEPLSPPAEEGESAELADMTRRFWIGVALSVPLLWAMLGEIVEPIDPMRIFGHGAVAWAQLALATPVVLWCGWPFLVRGWQSIVNRSLILEQLIEDGKLAVIGAKHDLATGHVQFFEDTWIADRESLQIVARADRKAAKAAVIGVVHLAFGRTERIFSKTFSSPIAIEADVQP